MSPPEWHFANFRLDPTNACLWRGAEAVTLPPKAFDVLHYLVTHPDRLIPKDELLEAVWPATTVSEAVVRVTIGTLRKALGDAAPSPRYIATVPRRGYRFVAPLTHAAPPDTASVLPAAAPLEPRPPGLSLRRAAPWSGAPRCLRACTPCGCRRVRASARYSS